ncbi:MAG: hypothetical protein RL660_370 [Bacteroidota bacterium]|jgi:uncharacterized membrane protein
MFAFSKSAVHFLNPQEKVRVHQAVKDAEQGNAGELRVFIEGKNKLVDPLACAADIFKHYKMHETEQRSGVLIYVAYKHREFAIFGDVNCVNKFPANFWATQAKLLHHNFENTSYVQGLVQCIENVQQQFMQHFATTAVKKNELPDEIIFGK